MTKKPERVFNVFAPLGKQVLYTAVLLCAMACSQQGKQKQVAGKNEKSFKAPRVTYLSSLAEKNKPRTILLDTVSKPPVIKTSIATRISQTAVISFEKQSGRINFSTNDTSNKTLVEDAQGRGFFSPLTSDDGINLDQVNCSFKDKWGNLWFGTNGGGVTKYDGKIFVTYTTAHGLADNLVWCITQDRNGNLWFGADRGGASKYDGRTFTNFSSAGGLANDLVFSITEDKKGNLWFGTNDGVSKWDGKSFTNYSVKEGLAANAVRTIFEDSKGSLWFGTMGGGVSKWDGKSFTNYSAREGLIGNDVLSITEDNSGNLWFGAEGKGLSKFDGYTFSNYRLFPDSSNDAVFCATKDKRGNLWFGTRRSGVLKYAGNVFTKYSTANGLANNQVRAITEDEKSNLWFSTYGGGIFKFAGNSFTNFTTAQGLASNTIFGIEKDKTGALWLATQDAGTSYYNGKRFVNFSKADGLPANEYYSVLTDRAGNVWFGTIGRGVWKFDGRNFTGYTSSQGLAGKIVFSIAEDAKGDLWFGTSGGGVSRFDGKSFTNYTTLQGLAGNDVFSIKVDKDLNLWFGTLGGGVSKFDGKSFTTYSTEQGLSDNVVWSVAEDDRGDLWFGTQHGLNLMEKREIIQGSGSDKKIHQPLFTSFTTEDGLPDNFVTQIVQGDNGRLYIGTNHGLCEMLPVKNQNASGKGWTVGRVFNTRNGYPVKDVNAGSKTMLKDSKGIIWIATGSDKTGLVRFEPGALADSNNSPPPVFISEIKLNNEAVSWRGITSYKKEPADSADSRVAATEEITAYGRILTDFERDSVRKRFANIKFDSLSKWQLLPQNLVLPYYFNNVTFSFGAVETGKNFLVNYKYFLEGYDKDWSPATRSTEVNFGNIYEGSYTLKVMAQSPEGTWSEPVTYRFTILPPWWRTWWMFMMYGVAVVTAVYLVTRWRHRSILRQKRILKRRIAVATKQLKEEAEKVRRQKRKIEDTLNELRETQAQLIQREKMASLGELTAGIAHEIQNPLNFINNFSEVNSDLLTELKEEAGKGNVEDVKAIADDVIKNQEKISGHGKRADAIVKGMLQHSGVSAGQKELTDINSLCDEYLRLSIHGMKAKDKNFHVELEKHFDKNTGKVAIVPQDVGRVLLNLFNNAFYAVNEKRKTQGQSYKPLVTVRTERLDGKVAITVADNGTGIPSKIINKIFQPFFTTKPTGQGTGLGLSLSYDIIKAHDGELKVETKENEGAVFKIILPTKTN